jgi:cardiolipin synthase
MALVTAGARGLDVELFVSEISDQFGVYHAQRSYYDELLTSGVRIFLYRAPTILHAKSMTVDDELSVIGSSNFDMRSFSLDYEISIMVRGRGFVEELREVEEQYRAVCKEITLEDWLERPRRIRVLDNTMRLTAALQ